MLYLITLEIPPFTLRWPSYKISILYIFYFIFIFILYIIYWVTEFLSGTLVSTLVRVTGHPWSGALAYGTTFKGRGLSHLWQKKKYFASARKKAAHLRGVARIFWQGVRSWHFMFTTWRDDLRCAPLLSHPLPTRRRLFKFYTFKNGLLPSSRHSYFPPLEISVRENVCNLSKNVKSHVFWIFKKNVKKLFLKT